jgi:CHAD domain-containing protein
MALGAVRDLDVQLAELEASLPGGGSRQLIEHYRHVLDSRRATARRRLLAALNSSRYQRLVRRFRAFLDQGPALVRPGTPAAAPVAAGAGALIDRAYRRAVRRGLRALRHPDPSRLHALRIACKRLRYTAEWFEGLYGRSFGKFLRGVVRLQDLLGAHHDAIVAQRQLKRTGRELLGSGASPRQVRRLTRRLARAHRRAAAKTEARFPARWKAFLRGHLRHALQHT